MRILHYIDFRLCTKMLKFSTSCDYGRIDHLSVLLRIGIQLQIAAVT